MQAERFGPHVPVTVNVMYAGGGAPEKGRVRRVLRGTLGTQGRGVCQQALSALAKLVSMPVVSERSGKKQTFREGKQQICAKR